MKKIKLGSLLFGLILLVTGCNSSLDDASRITKASENMSLLESYSTKIIMDIEGESSLMTLSFNVSMDADVDVKNEKNHMVMNMNILGMEISSEIYSIKNDDSYTVYGKLGDDDKWYKSNASSKENQVIDNKGLMEITSLIKDNTNIKKIATENNITHYKVTLDKDAVKTIINSTEQITGNENNLEEVKIKDNLIIDLYLTKDNYISKIDIDLSNVIDYDAKDNEISKYKLIIEFSNHNNLKDITVPTEIINNAIEQ